jgi:hypothetical protein
MFDFDQETSPTLEELAPLRLGRDPSLPVPLNAVNQFSSGMKQRLYRLLIPPQLLTRYNINPLSWEDRADNVLVSLKAGSHVTRLSCRHEPEAPDPFFALELADNAFNGIDLNLIVLSDPESPRFDIDRTEDGRPTLFGTVARNLEEEQRAQTAGLGPAQIRSGLGASRQVLEGLELFCLVLGQAGFYMEPLTYLNAWLFERRGCGYIRGRRLMQEIHDAFQPGGKLHAALDGSTPFRQPEQWRTVRGRAWAIHDGILEAIDRSWNGVRMARRVGYDAGVNTFPDAIY